MNEFEKCILDKLTQIRVDVSEIKTRTKFLESELETQRIFIRVLQESIDLILKRKLTN